jgi:hypothetical protein
MRLELMLLPGALTCFYSHLVPEPARGYSSG